MNSTKDLFDNTVGIKEVLNKKQLDAIVNAIIDTRVKYVIFSSITYGWKGIVEKLKERNKDIKITIFIDEQLTATNGYYDLRDSIKEELEHGIANFDYGTRHPNVFNADVQVYIHYCNSSKNYMIQASDILANRIWTSCRDNDPNLRKKDNQIILTFP